MNGGAAADKPAYTAEQMRQQAAMLESVGLPHCGPVTVEMLRQGADAVERLAEDVGEAHDAPGGE